MADKSELRICDNCRYFHNPLNNDFADCREDQHFEKRNRLECCGKFSPREDTNGSAR